MQVKKFSDFLNENVHDTPEEYVKTALTKLKRKIENYFEIPEKTEKDVGNTIDCPLPKEISS